MQRSTHVPLDRNSTISPPPGTSKYRRRGRIEMQRNTHMLAKIISLVSGCVTFLGGFLVVWGAVSLGLAIESSRAAARLRPRSPPSPAARSSSPQRSTSACSTPPGCRPRPVTRRMSLQIPIQKDIGEYEEKIVGKLSFRTLACLAGGFGSAILAAAIATSGSGIERRRHDVPRSCAHPCPSGSPGSGSPTACPSRSSRPLLIATHLDRPGLYEIRQQGAPRTEAGRPHARAKK